MKCAVCREDLDVVEEGQTTHPMCQFAEAGEDPAAQLLKSQLIDVITWHDSRNPRSLQWELGPSDLGTACDRRLGYRLAEVPAVNLGGDPWPTIVGTAVHSWLEKAFTDWCQSAVPDGQCDWAMETPLPFNEITKGHSDLYNRRLQTVIDWKTAGPDVMRKIRKDGPPPGYIVQVQVYGLGYEKLGLPVRQVALAFCPRAGWLKDMFVWVGDYDRNIAQAALDRIQDIANDLISANILNNPHRWEQIPHYPSNDCGFCPWYDPRRDMERGADTTGCPGR